MIRLAAVKNKETGKYFHSLKFKEQFDELNYWSLMTPENAEILVEHFENCEVEYFQLEPEKDNDQ